MKKGNIIVSVRKGTCQCQEEVRTSYFVENTTTMIFFPITAECVDMRKDICYLHYNRYGCTTPMSQNTTRKLCCCSMGQGWGQPCRACPSQGTSRYMRQEFSILVHSNHSTLLNKHNFQMNTTPCAARDPAKSLIQ